MIEAKIESSRSRLITTAAEVRDAETGEIVALGTAKYVPVPHDRNRAFMQTLKPDAATAEAARLLQPANA
jgi:hypothetical protein